MPPAGPIVGVVQARMTSSRLPGKTLLPIAGRPLLARLLDRLARCTTLDRLCVATTANPADDPIVELCQARSVSIHRGSEHDVLARCHDAAASLGARAVVRITGDCPLLDPAVVDAHVRTFIDAGGALDYVWCGSPPTLPNGMTCEVVSMAALASAHRGATVPYDREHVTPYLRRPENRYRIGAYQPAPDLSDLRLSVDTAEDLELVNHIWVAMEQHGPGFTMGDIARALHEHPQWRLINAHVVQKTGPHRPGGEAL